MTYHDHSTLPEALLEQLAASGMDALPELFRVLLNAAMQIERQKHLGAAPNERTEQRTGYANGYKDYPIAGWLLQKQINKKWSLGGELFGHGAEGEAATSTAASTLLDLGGTYEFKDGFDLLFAAGRSVYGQPETYTYLAAYWTWGPGGADEDADAGGSGAKMLNALTRMRPR